MNKTAIKNFAIWARNKLIADISYRAGLMGITADGIEKALPQSTGTTEFYAIGTAEPYFIVGDAVKQRRHLVELIRTREKETNYKTAYKYVLEEVAYTWFNRLIAVRFMEVNDYLPSHIRVLSSDSGKMEPDIVTTPFDAELSFTHDEEQLVYQLKQENKIDELFRILFIKQCNALNEILPALFEKTSDYTELLLNLSVIDQDGVVYHLVHDIPEEDFDVERGGQVEIIGWLYQYYNTEPKNEAFAKKGKIAKEELPAVTQLFTPDWIVRYMVENSLGRLWVEGHPNDELKAGWTYYLEEAEQEKKVQSKLTEIRAEYARLNPEDIKVIDPCMGSGHILVYAFDVLMQIYESAGYGQRDAARSILKNNLYGLDIDDRAFQMAYFAVMMKARQYNRRILNSEYKPNVYSIQESNGINRDQLKYFGAGLNEFEKNNAITQLSRLLDTFKDAKEYGSILLVDQYDWDLLNCFASNIEKIGQLNMYTIGLDDTAKELKQMIAQGKILSQKYHVTATNPPYMAASNASAVLKSYISKVFPDEKADLYAVFIKRCLLFAIPKGLVSMITMQTWMFLASFEKLRRRLSNKQFFSLAQIGYNSFPELNSKVAQAAMFTFSNETVRNYKGKYLDLTGKYPQSFDKEQAFIREKQAGFFLRDSFDFGKIDGSPFVYWMSEKMLKLFDGVKMGDVSEARIGLATGNNDYYIRLWQEVEVSKIGFGMTRETAAKSNQKWFPYNKGGEFRKWYGNQDYVINWQNDGHELQTRLAPDGKRIWAHNFNLDYIFKPQIAWSYITTSELAFRYYGPGFIFDSAGTASFTTVDMEPYVIAYLNSCVANRIAGYLDPTMHFTPGEFSSMPFINIENEEIRYLSNKCMSICREDWNAFENSWEFVKHPLVRETSLISDAYNEWERQCEDRFNELKESEERINEIFIDVYGLTNELENSVQDKYISVRKADRRRDICGLLSYAVGCMFGRYSLSSIGLAYAGGEWDEGMYGQFKPDTDNIIPISDEEYLEDDIVSRLCTFLKVAFGEGTLEENLDYIAKVLGNKGASSREVIRNYFLNDFFKDHCQTYSVTGSGKRPIYWLFDSGKENGFKALIYLHRYDADTIGNLRIDYLHRMQRIYESEISRMQDMIDHSTNAREVAQATKRREKLIKQLKECWEYDEKLAHLALSRIELDLDDGVKKNYRKIQTANDGKFYKVLADSKNIMSKE